MDGIALVRLALGVIADRLITIMGLSMSCALACWGMFDPVQNRVLILLIFVIFSYMVIQTKERTKDERPIKAAKEE
jgi:CHASE2 domain-containing sensor protein